MHCVNEFSARLGLVWDRVNHRLNESQCLNLTNENRELTPGMVSIGMNDQ